MNRPRILLADDHPMIFEGIRAVLAPQFEIVGTVGDGLALVEAALRLKPDLIVADVTMPLLNGIDAAIQIKKRLPGIKLVFFTMQSNSATVKAAFEAGGAGYVLKSRAGGELLDVVQSVLNSPIDVTPMPSTQHAELVQDDPKRTATVRLSTREREILQLVAEGRASKEIAYSMNISVRTVGFHREKIKKKLGLRTIAELTRYAFELGLVQ